MTNVLKTEPPEDIDYIKCYVQRNNCSTYIHTNVLNTAMSLCNNSTFIVFHMCIHEDFKRKTHEELRFGKKKKYKVHTSISLGPRLSTLHGIIIDEV